MTLWPVNSKVKQFPEFIIIFLRLEWWLFFFFLNWNFRFLFWNKVGSSLFTSLFFSELQTFSLPFFFLLSLYYQWEAPVQSWLPRLDRQKHEDTSASAVETWAADDNCSWCQKPVLGHAHKNLTCPLPSVTYGDKKQREEKFLPKPKSF